jgi:hypothetical protein
MVEPFGRKRFGLWLGCLKFVVISSRHRLESKIAILVLIAMIVMRVATVGRTIRILKLLAVKSVSSFAATKF